MGVNFGKNKDRVFGGKDGEGLGDDYVQLMQQLSPLADYLVINISSPNTPNLRALQKSSELSTILEQVLAERDRINAAGQKERPNDKGNVCPPILIKISPDLEPAQRKEIAQVALHYNVDGIIISNTTTARPIHGYDSQEVETAKEQGKTRSSLMLCLFACTRTFTLRCRRA